MKKVFLLITMSIAFLFIIGEFDRITIGIIFIKLLSLFYLWLVAKANNYFYQE